MRNDSEFKSEVFSRLEKVKHQKKIKKRIVLSVLPLLIVGVVIGTIALLGDNFIAFDEETADGGAEEIFNIGGVDQEADDSLSAGGTILTEDNFENESTELLSRVYTDKTKIDGFKALLGEFSNTVVTEGTAFMATGTEIILETDKGAEKFILVKDAVYTADMKTYCALNEESYSKILYYLKNTSADE